MERGPFKDLYIRFFPELMAYGKTFCNDERVIEDAIQEIFLNIWERKHKDSFSISSESYLFVALRNNLVKRNKELQLFINKGIALDDGAIIWENDKDTLIDKEEKVRELLNHLPPRQKEVIFLRYYKNKPYKEIAEILGVNYQVARNFAYRAIKFLKKNIQDLYVLLF